MPLSPYGGFLGTYTLPLPSQWPYFSVRENGRWSFIPSGSEPQGYQEQDGPLAGSDTQLLPVCRIPQCWHLYLLLPPRSPPIARGRCPRLLVGLQALGTGFSPPPSLQIVSPLPALLAQS